MTLVVAESDFSLVRGELRTFTMRADADRNKLGAFCPRCGTRIYHKLELRRDSLSVKPGTLDDTRWLNPAKHIWTRSKQPWVVIPEDAECHPQQPF